MISENPKIFGLIYNFMKKEMKAREIPRSYAICSNHDVRCERSHGYQCRCKCGEKLHGLALHEGTAIAEFTNYSEITSLPMPSNGKSLREVAI
jgi:hypothetical protein